MGVKITDVHGTREYPDIQALHKGEAELGHSFAMTYMQAWEFINELIGFTTDRKTLDALGILKTACERAKERDDEMRRYLEDDETSLEVE